APSARLDARVAGAEIDAVEVELENFRLVEFVLEPQGENELLDLAVEGARLGEEQVLGELLSQRRAALRDVAAREIGDDRAGDPDGVDPVMLVEPAILDGEEGLRQEGWEVLQRDGGAAHVAAGRQRPPVETKNLNRRRTRRHFERLNRRQVRRGPHEQADCRNGGPYPEDHAPIDQAPEDGAAASAVVSPTTPLRRRLVLVLVATDPRPRFFLRLPPFLAAGGRPAGGRFVGGGSGRAVARGEPQPEGRNRKRVEPRLATRRRLSSQPHVPSQAVPACTP